MRSFIVILCVVTLAGCATAPAEYREQMATTMQFCDNQEFQLFASCIKERYSRVGTQPGSMETREFYARLDVISESLANGTISAASAKSAAFAAYNETIGAANQRNEAINRQILQQRMQVQQQQQQQQQQYQQNMNQIYQNAIIRQPQPVIQSQPIKSIDYTCLNNCTAAGYQYGLCQSKCSY